jgi:hypothetical protein
MRYTVVAKMNDDMLEKPRGRPPRGFRDGGSNSFEVRIIFVWLQFSRVTAGLHISIDLLYHCADSLIAFWGARRRLQAWHGEQGRHRRQFDRWLPPGSSLHPGSSRYHYSPGRDALIRLCGFFSVRHIQAPAWYNMIQRAPHPLRRDGYPVVGCSACT